MHLAFENRALRDICESQARADRELGQPVAQALRRRLADLRAAGRITDVIAGNPHELDGGALGTMGIGLCGGNRLVLAANHVKMPIGPGGKVGWAQVSRVKILRIEVCNE